jgi:hypothetical protein
MTKTYMLGRALMRVRDVLVVRSVGAMVVMSVARSARRGGMSWDDGNGQREYSGKRGRSLR